MTSVSLHAGRAGCALLLSIWGATAGADEGDGAVHLSGALRGHYFGSSRTLDDRADFFGTSLQLKGVARPTEQVSMKMEARAIAPALGRSDPHSEAQLIEGYMSLNEGRWDWRLGKQIVAWGRADGINPTDVVSPRDATILLPFDADQRSGLWGVVGSYAWTSETSLSVLWKTDFEASRMPVPLAQRSAYRFEQPPHPGAQWGLRLNRTGGDVDWSVSLFRGRSLWPHAGPNQAADGATLRLTYPTVTMLGADLATNFGDYGTRFEAAYTTPAHPVAPHEPGLRRNVYWVAGVDRTFFPRLNVNVQVFARHSWGLPTNLPPRYQWAGAFNAATFMQQRPWVHGVTLRISNAWLHDTLDAEVFVQRFLPNDGTFVQPMVGYAFTDSVRGTLGAQLYTGSGPQLGPLKANRGAFAELRYAF
ncbi:DUF1302 family protein [Ideonella sp. DXS29W]|uniref:DUF1302 family protein n=1 Tax=Ideonella lacteola TaxID=2984193 RepID=A0ABU9BVJ2_9BURK